MTRVTKQVWSVAGILAGAVLVGVAQQKPPDPNDPRVGLEPGLYDAGVAARHMELTATLPRPKGFFDPREFAGDAMPPAGAPPRPPRPPGGLDFANSDLAFAGTHLWVGNFNGLNLYDIETARRPRLLASIVCPGGQRDVPWSQFSYPRSACRLSTRARPVTQGGDDVLSNVPQHRPHDLCEDERRRLHSEHQERGHDPLAVVPPRQIRLRLLVQRHLIIGLRHVGRDHVHVSADGVHDVLLQ